MNNTNRIADLTDLNTIDGVAIRVWLLADGGVIESREDRRTTVEFSRRLFDANSGAAWCYHKMVEEAAQAA